MYELRQLTFCDFLDLPLWYFARLPALQFLELPKEDLAPPAEGNLVHLHKTGLLAEVGLPNGKSGEVQIGVCGSGVKGHLIGVVVLVVVLVCICILILVCSRCCSITSRRCPAALVAEQPCIDAFYSKPYMANLLRAALYGVTLEFIIDLDVLV